MMEAYKTIQGTAQARIEEKKSEFIAHAAFADTEEKALAFLNGIRAKHRTASHNVYAYILRDGARMRYSDDGEPAKTSGLPTLEAHPPRGPCGLHRCDDALFRRYAVGHWRAGARLYSGGKRRSGGGKAGDGTGVRAGRFAGGISIVRAGAAAAGRRRAPGWRRCSSPTG